MCFRYTLPKNNVSLFLRTKYGVHTWFISVNDRLESTDTAPEVPHSRPTRDAAFDAVARASDHVCVFFFFFSRIRADSARFAPMRLDSCRIDFDSRRIGLIRPKSGHIGR